MKKTMKKMVTLLLAVIMCIGLCACGGTEGGQGASSKGDSDETVELTWWAAYSTVHLNVIREIVDDFNASQDKYYVEVLYQGSTTELRTQLEALQPKDYPSIFSGQPITTAQYAASSYTVPFQNFVDADEDDWTADIYESVRMSYCDKDGNMIGCPFGTSATGFYVNTTALEAGGYTLDDITTFEDMCNVAIELVKKGIVQHGIGIRPTGVHTFDMLTLQGVDVVDKDNGYSGNAETCLYDVEGETQDAVLKTTQLISKLYANGAGFSYGSDVYSEHFPLLASGDMFACFGTNSYATRFISCNPQIEWTFVTTQPLDKNGKYMGEVMAEGTGNYIANTGDEAEMQGAYEFIKYLCTTEPQLYMVMNTGYVPYTSEAAASSEYQAWAQENFPSSLDVLDKISKSSGELRGPYISVGSSLLGMNNQLYSDIATNPSADAKTVISDCAKMLNDALEIANLRSQYAK